MSPDQTRIVQDTWKQVVPIADTAANLFYDRLFEIDPSTRPLFTAETLPEQKRKLIVMLNAVVNGLKRPEEIIPAAEALARRHVGYGVTAPQYDSVGAALLWTLEKGLGPSWTAEAQQAWTAAYDLLSGVMRRAAA
ncbi:hemin receptor [Roseomonas eburnea]|uniref:Hemin receptor n=1 Tax=Neoroseomonas eburnea TaxID=1346889 RepID=A0A9X9XII9_9PROT|nr:globin family protein [Neoroseomonas eburnea]MBR0683525.1 hemin receptor [Neoroseomonas eburnea]